MVVLTSWKPEAQFILLISADMNNVIILYTEQGAIECMINEMQLIQIYIYKINDRNFTAPNLMPFMACF